MVAASQIIFNKEFTIMQQYKEAGLKPLQAYYRPWTGFTKPPKLPAIVHSCLPMCHNEFGPGTEYGWRLTEAGKDLNTRPRGSINRNAFLTLSRITLTPLALRLPHTIVTPQYGWCCLNSLIVANKSISLITVLGSCSNPYSKRRLHVIISIVHL